MAVPPLTSTSLGSYSKTRLTLFFSEHSQEKSLISRTHLKILMLKSPWNSSWILWVTSEKRLQAQHALGWTVQGMEGKENCKKNAQGCSSPSAPMQEQCPKAGRSHTDKINHGPTISRSPSLKGAYPWWWPISSGLPHGRPKLCFTNSLRLNCFATVSSSLWLQQLKKWLLLIMFTAFI